MHNIQTARARIPLSDVRVILGAHRQVADGPAPDFIIVNRTFSWWGTWLAGRAGKQVIAPAFEMRRGKMWWGFEGLLPAEWIKL